eukprot:NODE_116_length_18347_cov_2.280962.p2 type:complete len:509 gc:universal NODE_116_length_18347_cov_2.280962:5900-4374(-)
MKRDVFFASQELINLVPNVKDLVLYAFYLRENAFNGLECGKSFKEASNLLAQAAGVFLHLESSELDVIYLILKEITLLEASELYFLQAKKDGRFSKALMAKMSVSISDGFSKISKTFKELPLDVKSLSLAKSFYYHSMANFYSAENEDNEKVQNSRYCIAFQMSEKSIRILKKLEHHGLLYRVESWKATLLSKIPAPGKLQMIWNNVPPLQAFEGPIVLCSEFNLSEFLLPLDLPEFLKSYVAKAKPRLKSIERIRCESLKVPKMKESDLPEQASSVELLITDLSDNLVECRKGLWELENDYSLNSLKSNDILATIKDINNILDNHEIEFKKFTQAYGNDALRGATGIIKPIYDSSDKLDTDYTNNLNLAVIKYETDSVVALKQRIKSIKGQLEVSQNIKDLEAFKSLDRSDKGSFIKSVWHSLSRKSKSSSKKLSAISIVRQENPDLKYHIEKSNLYQDQHKRFFSQQSESSLKIYRMRSRTNERVSSWLNSKHEEDRQEFNYPVLF